MKHLLCSLIAALSAIVTCMAASPSYNNFNTNDFTTNTVIGGQISIRVNTNRFLTTNSVVSELWGTNAAGFITNKNFGWGVHVDGHTFDTNEVILFGPVSGSTGFRFQPFSFHGVGFNIDSEGNGTAFGTDVNNSSNWWQIGRTRLVPIIEVTSNDFVFVGTNATFKRRITNEVLTADMLVGTDANKALKSIATPVTSWLPTPGYEVWYEPFGAGDNATGLAGALGWSPTGTGSVNFSNSVNHWGTLALSTSTTAGSFEQAFLSDTLQTRSTIPPLDATVGWTNRIIWRCANTNSVRAYLVLEDCTFTITQEPTNCIGIQLVTTNTTIGNQIMGFTSGGALGNFSTTNLGVLVDNIWHTNEIWSATSGVISFTLDGGAEATLNSNIPTRSLTPAFDIRKPTLTAALSTLEIDEWVIIMKRQP